MDGSTGSGAWRRSSRCGSNACVEIAQRDHSILLRDSEDPNGPRLEFGFGTWSDFVDAIKCNTYARSPGS